LKEAKIKMGILKDKITWARVKSPWVLHFNSGACNGCDIEIVALLTPKFDVERFGVKLEPSPRHADVLLVTGCVTQQCAERLKRIYDQMPQPKFVVAIGACACSGGVFAGNYNVLGGADKVIPVTAYIPGCPPRPEAMLDGVVKLLNALSPPKIKKQKKQAEQPKAEEKPQVAQINAPAKPEAPIVVQEKPAVEEAKPVAK
jgi:ech hydrogenase subunit C